jgi:hypothetical protein
MSLRDNNTTGSWPSNPTCRRRRAFHWVLSAGSAFVLAFTSCLLRCQGFVRDHVLYLASRDAQDGAHLPWASGPGWKRVVRGIDKPEDKCVLEVKEGDWKECVSHSKAKQGRLRMGPRRPADTFERALAVGRWVRGHAALWTLNGICGVGQLGLTMRWACSSAGEEEAEDVPGWRGCSEWTQPGMQKRKLVPQSPGQGGRRRQDKREPSPRRSSWVCFLTKPAPLHSCISVTSQTFRKYLFVFIPGMS